MNYDKLKNIIFKMTTGDNDNSLKLFQMFYFERLLERISNSKYNGQIILKGGLLLSSIIGSDERTTKDMDATLKGIPLNKDIINKIFKEIININLNDDVSFEIINIKDIRLDDKYNGFKLNILAKFNKNKTFIAVELTTGDKITPKEMNYNYKCIFEEKTIPIMSYTLETIIAEKFETVISRGILNTRMKDFYDIYILMNFKQNELNNKTLAKAINKTFKNRETLFNIKEFYIILNEIKNSDDLAKSWIKYQNKNKYVKNINYIDAITALEQVIKILEKETILV